MGNEMEDMIAMIINGCKVQADCELGIGGMKAFGAKFC